MENPLTEDEVSNSILYSTKNLDGMLSNKKQTINIIWSGGCDSTLVLYEILVELKARNDDRIINAYSFYHSQLNDVKMIWEKQKRNRFLMWIEDKGFNNKILNHEINLNKDIIKIGSNSCCQPAMWVSQILPIIEDNSVLFAGYHMGDDFFTYKVFRQWLKAFTSISNLFGKKTDFCVPLIYRSKNEIIKDIKNVNGLYENTWWCENASGKPCGCCDPCINHEVALIYFEKQKVKDYINTIEVKDIKKADKDAVVKD